MNGFSFILPEGSAVTAKADKPCTGCMQAAEVSGYDPCRAWHMARLSALAYRPDDYVWANIGRYFPQPLVDCALFDRRDIQVFVASTEKIAVIVFRGTDSFEDALTNMRCDLGDHLVSHGRVHRGFADALNAVWSGIAQQLSGMLCGQALFLTGHSLGAAVATLCAYRLKMMGQSVAGLYTFGSPRVGDAEFARFFDALMPETYRIVNNNDIVARVPLLTQQYRHVGRLKYIDESGRLHNSLTAWQRLRFWAAGVWADRFELGPDALKDHAMAQYEDSMRLLFLRHRIDLAA